MTLAYSTTVKNARLDAVETVIGGTAVLKIRTGSPPGIGAEVSGTVLATLTLPADWMAAASGGSKAKNGTWEDLSADASGTAAHFRIYANDGSTQHIEGTAGTAGTDMILDNDVFNAGQAFTVNTFTITSGN